MVSNVVYLVDYLPLTSFNINADETVAMTI